MLNKPKVENHQQPITFTKITTKKSLDTEAHYILQQDVYLVSSGKGIHNTIGPTLRIKPNTIYNKCKVHPTPMTPVLEIHTKDTHNTYTSILGRLHPLTFHNHMR
jgi:hypothetical protein